MKPKSLACTFPDGKNRLVSGQILVIFSTLWIWQFEQPEYTHFSLTNQYILSEKDAQQNIHKPFFSAFSLICLTYQFLENNDIVFLFLSLVLTTTKFLSSWRGPPYSKILTISSYISILLLERHSVLSIIYTSSWDEWNEGGTGCMASRLSATY